MLLFGRAHRDSDPFPSLSSSPMLPPHPPLSFGWDYRNACTLDLTDILMELKPGCPDTVLYDIFLQNGVSSLYPVPVKITNYLPSGSGSNSPTTDPTVGESVFVWVGTRGGLELRFESRQDV